MRLFIVFLSAFFLFSHTAEAQGTPGGTSANTYYNNDAVGINTGTGAVQLKSYGSGTFTGTATKNLSVDSSGNVIETDAGGGGGGDPAHCWRDGYGWLAIGQSYNTGCASPCSGSHCGMYSGTTTTYTCSTSGVSSPYVGPKFSSSSTSCGSFSCSTGCP